METNEELTDQIKLNRSILKVSWWTVLFIILLSIVGLFITLLFNRGLFWQHLVHDVFPETVITIVILLLTEGLCKLFKQWDDYIILFGLFFAMLVNILFHPTISGVQNLLFPVIFISALYFDRTKVYFTSVLCFVTAILLSVYYSKHFNETAVENLMISIGIYASCTVISLGIIQRGKYLLNHLEDSIKSQEELLIRNILMDKASKLDPLTDLYNHKTFHEYIERLIEQSESYPLPLQLAIIDIDNFKKVNDNYGHWVGDIVLKRVGDEIKGHVTSDDFVSRYGGEEFAVILTDKQTDAAYTLIEEMRDGISKMIHPELDNQAVTVSIGMCSYSKGLGKENFFKTTDECLYQAKRNGKNQTVLANIHREPVSTG
ncbi:diguanylate cyclase [Bacillus sp. BRMEA1]|uniref:GGDEF domain-containing protein n=1 Tax=Neobacillus endophyticus TaxID=2738405 RepID=UPI001563CC77|nr:diguanylate cyclase [Neobacillus endophyticus]NRD76774.1 diguanylate cyclase [Neobacillus endophyticus]